MKFRIGEHTVEAQQVGKNFKMLCPFHKEQTPGMAVNTKKMEYYCFGCGAKGKVEKFLV